MFFNKKPPTTIIKEIRSLNFDTDIVFLNKLISHKIDFYFKYKVMIQHNISTYNLSDRHIKPVIIQIFADIKNSISKDHYTVLLKYFSESGLDDYISEIIITRINESYKKITHTDINKISGEKKEEAQS